MLKLATYHIYEGGELPPFAPHVMYEYWLAGGGVYLRASRTGLEVLIPLARGEIRGLASLQPFIRLAYPRVPQEVLLYMLELSRHSKDIKGRPLEKLFHLSYDETAGRWRLEIPAQLQTRTSVRPVESGTGSSYERALLELHSHHALPAFFSQTDDRDEARSFRLFAVIGRIFEEKPEIRLRVGIFGYFWEIPAGKVFEIPDWLEDGVTGQPSQVGYTKNKAEESDYEYGE